MALRHGAAIAMVATLVAVGPRVRGDEPSASQLKFFEEQVRPLLAEHCQRCHGDQKQKGHLRLDSLASILKGGDSGPAIEPGKPEESLLVEAINYDGLEMPPTGKLDDAQVAVLTRWVAMGAPWPAADRDRPRPATGAAKITDADRAFWAFRPLSSPAAPVANSDAWSRNPIDRFVFEKLREQGLAPAPEADRRTLIRRASFDLLGLPPSPEEVEAFVADPSPTAYEALIDRMLARPEYGQRWARHWLDLVRYAESDGFRADGYRPDAWRYRDFVVRSFNDDKPYDRFVAEQLAGDEIAPDDPAMRVATGFLRLTPYERNQRDVRGQWADHLNDLTDVAGEVFLGLGIGCARCHDHKFDPILRDDYYRLQAFFAPLRTRDDLPLATPEEQASYREKLALWEAQTAEIRGEIDAILRPAREAAAKGAVDKFPEDIQAILRKPEAERSPLEQQLYDFAYNQVEEELDKIDAKPAGAKIKGDQKKRLEGLLKRLAEFDRDKPAPLASVRTATDVGPVAPPTVVPGDRTGREIVPGFLTVLAPGPAPVPAPSATTTMRRATLARWLTRPDNPLTTRVIANRIWQYHFGRGLVATSNDFGRVGERPSHPELLDWLSSRFVADGWSFKAMHRLIMTSATYRQSSQPSSPEATLQKDPENRLFGRAGVRRLDAEMIRDAMLVASGELDGRMGGPASEASSTRRTIDTKVVRNSRDDLLDAFDAPGGFLSTARRNVTTTPTQALLLINGPWPLARAKALAARLVREVPDGDRARVDRAYRVAFGRPPDDSEMADAVDFLDRQAGLAPDAPRDAALVDLCHALLNASEFLYVE
jgi:mono/diheme cytochrome c family protein